MKPAYMMLTLADRGRSPGRIAEEVPDASWICTSICRTNETSLFNSPRLIRIVHRAEALTPETIAGHCIPAMQAAFTPLDGFGNVFGRIRSHR
jgi:hypothetical protein